MFLAVVECLIWALQPAEVSLLQLFSQLKCVSPACLSDGLPSPCSVMGQVNNSKLQAVSDVDSPLSLSLLLALSRPIIGINRDLKKPITDIRRVSSHTE